MSSSGFGGLAHEPFSSRAGVTPIAMPARWDGAKMPVPEQHTILGGGHCVVYEAPKTTAQLFLDLLKKAEIVKVMHSYGLVIPQS